MTEEAMMPPMMRCIHLISLRALAMQGKSQVSVVSLSAGRVQLLMELATPLMRWTPGRSDGTGVGGTYCVTLG
jgi:hypothetical protein